MLACASPQEGQHNDLFNIKELFNELCETLIKAGINLNGLFLNADAGFDSQELRELCYQKGIFANIDFNHRNNANQNDYYVYFDEELYKKRTVIKQANAWLDSFKALLIRYETKAINWVAFNFIAFAVCFLRKININTKS